MKKNNFKYFLLLHMLLLVYSFCDILSKSAGTEEFLSKKFILFYFLMIVLLFIYAVGWQQVIKKLPLTLAFANKAVTIFWGLFWGFFIFKEDITIGKIIGCLLVIAGVIMFSLADRQENDHE